MPVGILTTSCPNYNASPTPTKRQLIPQEPPPKLEPDSHTPTPLDPLVTSPKRILPRRSRSAWSVMMALTMMKVVVVVGEENGSGLSSGLSFCWLVGSCSVRRGSCGIACTYPDPGTDLADRQTPQCVHPLALGVVQSTTFRLSINTEDKNKHIPFSISLHMYWGQ